MRCLSRNIRPNTASSKLSPSRGLKPLLRQNIADSSLRNRVVARFGIGKNAVRHVGLATVFERAVEAVDEFASSNGHEELFQRGHGGGVAAFDGLHIPSKSCLGILRAREAVGIVERFILRLREVR